MGYATVAADGDVLRYTELRAATTGEGKPEGFG
jgi:hypothetical protein